MAQLVLPRVQAMLICDDVAKSSHEKGVYYLNGVRYSLAFSSFPATQAHLCVFLHLSGHRGEASCFARVFQSTSEELIFRSKAKTIVFEDPISVVPMLISFRNCVFPAPGVYFVEMLADDKVIGERRLEIRQEG